MQNAHLGQMYNDRMYNPMYNEGMYNKPMYNTPMHHKITYTNCNTAPKP